MKIKLLIRILVRLRRDLPAQGVACFFVAECIRKIKISAFQVSPGLRNEVTPCL
jgi:hypothetical protein